MVHETMPFLDLNFIFFLLKNIFHFQAISGTIILCISSTKRQVQIEFGYENRAMKLKYLNIHIEGFCSGHSNFGLATHTLYLTISGLTI